MCSDGECSSGGEEMEKTENQPTAASDKPSKIQRLPPAELGILTEQPQQSTTKFPSGVTISSEFDSGNLANCSQAEGKDKLINCWMSGDGLPYTNVGHYKSWFYFSINGIQNGDTYTFCMRNMGL